MPFSIPSKRVSLQHAIFKAWLVAVILTTVVSTIVCLYTYAYASYLIPVETLNRQGKSGLFKDIVTNLVQSVLSLFLPMGAVIITGIVTGTNVADDEEIGRNRASVVYSIFIIVIGLSCLIGCTIVLLSTAALQSLQIPPLATAITNGILASVSAFLFPGQSPVKTTDVPPVTPKASLPPAG